MYKGSIYKLVSPNTDKVYIGSTTKPLTTRFSVHKSKYNTNTGFCSSKIMFDFGDVSVELIEKFECNTRKELTRREGEIQRLYPNRVNKRVAGRSHDESVKAYYSENRDKILQNFKVKLICECGGKYTSVNKSTHLKTNKHINYQNTN